MSFFVLRVNMRTMIVPGTVGSQVAALVIGFFVEEGCRRSKRGGVVVQSRPLYFVLLIRCLLFSDKRRQSWLALGWVAWTGAREG